MKHMGFRIPLKIVNTAHQANLLYPFAISLLESIRTYDSINERIANKSGVNMLIVTYKKDIQGQLAEVSMFYLKTFCCSNYFSWRTRTKVMSLM